MQACSKHRPAPAQPAPAPAPGSPTHLRSDHMPLMPGSSTSACSTTPMPLRTMRSEPSTPAPLHVTTCGRGGGAGGGVCTCGLESKATAAVVGRRRAGGSPSRRAALQGSYCR